MRTQSVEYRHGDAVLEGFLAVPATDGERRPGILVSHAWGGRDDFVVEKAKALAELGYAAFALDVYGKGVRGSGPEQNQKLMMPFLQDRALLRDRLKSGMDCFAAQPGVDGSQIAIMGYCFGGLCALDLARSGAAIKGAVSFHGLFIPPALPKQAVKARVLALHGYDDPMVPPQQVLDFATEMNESKVDWQMHAYGGVLHAFTVPEANDLSLGALYNARAARRSWQAMMDFFEEIFD